MIKVRHRCGECLNGMVVNPIWEDFREKYPQVFRFDCPDEEFDAAAIEFCPEGIHDEPEEIPCEECNGTGYVEEWRDAYEVARELRRLAQTDEECFRTT